MLDAAGIPFILVGDTLGMVVQGHETTLPVTLDQIIYHARMVERGARRALVVGDLPFMTYLVSVEDALRNATVPARTAMARSRSFTTCSACTRISSRGTPIDISTCRTTSRRQRAATCTTSALAPFPDPIRHPISSRMPKSDSERCSHRSHSLQEVCTTHASCDVRLIALRAWKQQ